MNGEKYIRAPGPNMLDSKNLERKNMGIDIGSEFSDVWVLPAALRQLQECGESALMEELLAIFQTDTAERLEVLVRAVETTDYATVRQEAHTIKGSALQVGANRVAEFCRQMELEARKARPEYLVSLFHALLQSFDEVRGVIAARSGPATDGPRHYGK
jgi:HPt (histidine-containing phosphotransfer) domain-containing protein